MADAPPPGRSRPLGPAERRKVLALAIERRPGMTVAELHGTLLRLGFDVDEATVAADLDALGGAGRSAPTRDVPGPPPAPGPASGVPSIGAPVVTAAPAPPPPAPSAPSRSRARRPLLTLVGALAIVLAVLAVVFVLQDDDAPSDTATGGSGPVLGEGSTPGGSTPGGAGSGSSEPMTASTQASPEVAPTGPGRDPALNAAADLTFSFATDGDALPEAGDQGPWTEAAGAWVVLGGRAAPTAVDGDGPALAYFSAPGPDLRAQVSLPTATPGSGLAFRVEGPDDYLAWVIAPEGGTVELYDVVAGEATKVFDSGRTVLDPGVSLGVNVVGDALELLANGVVVMTTTDTGRAPGVGLVSIAPGEGPTYDDMLVLFGE